MPRIKHLEPGKRLTATVIERAKPEEKQYYLPDFDGLYICVYPSGKKTWIVRWWKDGREHQKTVGIFPQVTLVMARQRRDNLKAVERYDAPDLNELTLDELHDQWIREIIRPNVAEKTLSNIELRYRNLSALGPLPLSQVTRERIIEVMNQCAQEKSADTVKRSVAVLHRLLDYAIDLGKITLNPAVRLDNAVPILKSWKAGHFAAALSHEEVGRLLRAIEHIRSFEVRQALKFIAYTFVRSGELRQAKWPEINFAEKLWTIPADHTKLRREQLVPLSLQAIDILESLRGRAGKTERGYIFTPSRNGRIMSKTTMLLAMQSLRGELTGEQAPPPATVHGFRATASTILHEAEFDHLVIERQLAHVDRNSVSAAYNRAEYLSARRAMMQWYADALDALRDQKPLPLRTTTGEAPRIITPNICPSAGR